MDRVLAAYFSRGAYRHPGPEEFIDVVNSVSGQDLTWFFDTVYRSAATFDYAVEDVVTHQTESGAFDSTVIIRRLADGVFPVDVRVTFEDGASVTERWDGRDSWRALHYRRASTIATVEVDPDRVLVLDAVRTNNTWTAHPQRGRAADKWALRWLAWFQHVLVTYAFFA
jgi:aminopeptidase N